MGGFFPELIRMEEKPIGQMGLREVRELARLRMPREAWEHFMGAAVSEVTDSILVWEA